MSIDWPRLYGATFEWVKDALPMHTAPNWWQELPPELWIDKVHDFVGEELDDE